MRVWKVVYRSSCLIPKANFLPSFSSRRKWKVLIKCKCCFKKNSHCPPSTGTYCNIEGKCVAAEPCQTHDDPCPSDFGCDLSIGVCLPSRKRIVCKSHDDCSNGRLCAKKINKCLLPRSCMKDRNCKNKGYCDYNLKCRSYKCRPYRSSDCRKNEYCSKKTKRCEIKEVCSKSTQDSGGSLVNSLGKGGEIATALECKKGKVCIL